MERTNRPLTVAALLLALFMAAMEMTVVSTAMPTVIGDLGGIERYAWVFTAYMLAATITVPLYGKLADLYGRKPILLFGIAVFLVGSIASGQARTIDQLIVFRALQGLGAGSMQPVAITIIGDIFEVEERARMQGIFGAVWGVAGLVGPLLGGFIVKALSWRWVFYVNVPFGLASAALLTLAFRERVEKKHHRLDLLGAGCLAVGVMALLVASRGQGTASWIAAVTALAAMAAFLAVERRAPEPLLPIDLFAKRVMAVTTALGALVGGAMIATVTFVPLYVQAVLGGSPTDAGSAITPMVIAWPIASALSGRILPKLGFRALVWMGLGLSAFGAFELAFNLSPGMSLSVPRVTTAIFGAGLGLANTALIIAVQTSVAWEQRGVATASTMFFRTIGGTLSVGALGSILARALAKDASIPTDAANNLLGPEHGHSLPPAIVHALAAVLASAMQALFWVIAAIAAGAFLVSGLFPKVPMPAQRAAPRSGVPPAPPVPAVDTVEG
jgi:EmrB/QacA subfamily drug resistance transporter